MKVFKDKVIWITGASSGIGEALAMQFAKQEARLILSARREDELKRVATLTKLPELDLLILPFDLADTKNASALIAQIMNKFGRIDILNSVDTFLFSMLLLPLQKGVADFLNCLVPR